MAKAGNLTKLRNKLPAASRVRVDARVKSTLDEIALDELRAAREFDSSAAWPKRWASNRPASRRSNGAPTCTSALWPDSSKLGLGAANWRSVPCFRRVRPASRDSGSRRTLLIQRENRAALDALGISRPPAILPVITSSRQFAACQSASWSPFPCVMALGYPET